MFAATVGAVVAAIVRGQPWGGGSGRVIGLFAVGAVGLVFSVWRMFRHPVPVIEPAIVRIRAVALADVPAGIVAGIGPGLARSSAGSGPRSEAGATSGPGGGSEVIPNPTTGQVNQRERSEMSVANLSADWIRRYHPAPDAAARMLCLPHAGGSASFFFPMSRDLTPRVEVLAVQYPGRWTAPTRRCWPTRTSCG